MKKTLTVMTLLAGAVSGYSQGLISFGDYQGVLQQQIFNTQASAPSGAQAVVVSYGGYTTSEYVGSTAAANELPAGSAVFTSPLSGTGYDAQLYAALGSGVALGSLTAQGTGPLHFYTTATALGFIKGTSTDTLGGAAAGSPGPTTVAIAAWAATGSAGAAATLAAAQADGYAWGFSTTELITPNSTTPTALPTAGLTGFSLGTVPEPSTIALGVMGASTLLFRRKK